MTPERIEELRGLLKCYQVRGRDENKLLAFASEVLAAAERLARIAAILRPLEALEAAATEAPWHKQPIEIVFDLFDRHGVEPETPDGYHFPWSFRDAAVIAAARNALPALLREIQENQP